MKNILFLISLMLVVASGCKKAIQSGHNQQPYDRLSPLTAFSTENDLQLYIYSFYKSLPSPSDVYKGDQTSDIMQRRDLTSFLSLDGYSAAQSGGWSWGDLRNINYFINQVNKLGGKKGFQDEVLKNDLGIARFFRAWFYFDKVKRYGGVPWYNKALDPSDSAELYKPRDSRTLIMDSVLADLNYACDNIDDKKDNSCATITKWVALAFKSRVCLFEGTFRKYHDELGLQGSVGQWLNEVVDASQKIMEGGLYSIHKDPSNPEMSYSELFHARNSAPPSDEVMLSENMSSALNVLHDATWDYTSPTKDLQASFVKEFINTFLEIDGTRFTDKPGYTTLPFWDEVKNRDWRLQQSIRMGNYSRGGELTPPDWSYTSTGYQPIKFTLHDKFADGSAVSDNSIPLIRYAEVLLNYAEAKAELGTFTASDWDKTIKVLRQRAGITNTSMPVTADQYLETNFYPGISNPVILEIRRCRAIELALEGFRYDDLLRWKLGKNLEKLWKGMYVPQMDVLYDLNQDGKPEVSFVNKVPANKVKGVVYRVVDGEAIKLTEGNKGNIIYHSDLKRVWADKKYYYPIPLQETILNPNLEQNPGWE